MKDRVLTELEMMANMMLTDLRDLRMTASDLAKEIRKQAAKDRKRAKRK